VRLRAQGQSFRRVKQKVLFIAGWMRSGSTLLDVLLGGAQEFFSTGELSSLWERGLVKGRRCGCGMRVRDCPVWTSVLDEARDDDGERIDPRAMIRRRARAIRLKHLPRLLLHDRLAPWEPLDRYIEHADGLYRALGRVTGAHVVVDSSKLIQDAAVLRLLPNVDPYLVHLVRDPRAVARSMQRATMLQAQLDDPVRMPRSSVWSSSSGWSRTNLAAELVRLRYGRERSMRVRYEDLAADPQRVLASVARFVGEEGKVTRFRGRCALDLPENHTVWGNSLRFVKGALEVSPDEEWRERLHRFDRLASTAIALPLLPRYRYPVRAA
jgi:hypothetical protein